VCDVRCHDFERRTPVGYFVDEPLHSQMVSDIESAQVLAELAGRGASGCEAHLMLDYADDVSLPRLLPTNRRRPMVV